MGTGIDMQCMAAKESNYGTRVTPTRVFELLPGGDGLAADYNYYVSSGLGGGGPWRRRRVQTTKPVAGALRMEVPTVGFGFWLDLLTASSPTVVQQAATSAYLTTATLTTAPTKSATVQLGRPPTSGSVAPFDYLGVIVTGMTFSWTAAGILTVEIATIGNDEKTDQTLATLTVPTSSGLFSFKGGSVSIGGSTQSDIIGDGSVSIAWPMRSDAFPLGSNGLIAKPIVNGLPTATGQFVADFDSLAHYNRITGGTIADVVIQFTNNTIASTYKEMIKITIPDCGFTGVPPQVADAGPLQETVGFESASAASNVPKIEYQSTDTTV